MINDSKFIFDASNRFHLMLCDVTNYNDVIYAADSYQSVRNARFTDIEIAKKL